MFTDLLTNLAPAGGRPRCTRSADTAAATATAAARGSETQGLASAPTLAPTLAPNLLPTLIPPLSLSPGFGSRSGFGFVRRVRFLWRHPVRCFSVRGKQGALIICMYTRYHVPALLSLLLLTYS